MPLDVVSSSSSVAILVQVVDSAEFLLRVAVERVGLDTAEILQAWKSRSRFRSSLLLLGYISGEIAVKHASVGRHKAR